MMGGPLPSLNVSSSAGGPGVPQNDMAGGPKPPKRKVNFDASAEGQMLYGGGGGGEAPGSDTMSRVLSLRTTKSAGSLFNFNAEDPAELLATAFDLPSMRGVPEQLASPRTKKRAAGMSSAMADRPAYVRVAACTPPAPCNARPALEPCASHRKRTRQQLTRGLCTQMTLDNEDGTTPNYGGEREPNLETGKDAANFFARNRGAASIKFVHLNPEQTGDDYRPYDLVVVRPEDVRNACWLSALSPPAR